MCKTFLIFCVTAKKKKALNTISLLASSTLAKASFLCSVLSEDPECHYLAFKIGMFGMELARPPASCKALEVISFTHSLVTKRRRELLFLFVPVHTHIYLSMFPRMQLT
jgi:hypothetical protein